jgi:benzoylformate decarboxylase
MTFVIPNNGGYRIIKQRLKAFHGSSHFVGMDFADPAVDFAAIARGYGLPAERVSDPAAVPGVLAHACNRSGPSLVEVMVDGRI